ncbi:hypothetical protein [Burkholderia cenocepacia]|uniref:hypothetical protein n=1 Tax=Burkholderia cenocepacia TaxID=95486 RepID=UPI001177D0C4|nr:hypothetical protein [Burkholderia cenocepacia]
MVQIAPHRARADDRVTLLSRMCAAASREKVAILARSPKETLINEPVVRITDEAGCNFQIDVGI